MNKKLILGFFFLCFAFKVSAAPSAQILVNGGSTIVTQGVVITLKGQSNVNINQYSLTGDLTVPEVWSNIPVSASKNVVFNVVKTLVNLNATNNLYVKFRDVNLSESFPITASVYVDYNAAGGPVLAKANLLGPGVFTTSNISLPGTNTEVNSIWFSAVDNNGTISSFKIYGDFDPTYPGGYVAGTNEFPITANSSILQTYNNSIATRNIKMVKFTAGEGTKNYEVIFYDNDNIPSDTKYYSIILDQNPPTLITANQIAADLALHPTVTDYTNQTQLLRLQVQGDDTYSGIDHYLYSVYEVSPYEGEEPLLKQTNSIYRGQDGFPTTSNNFEAIFNVAQTLRTTGEKYFFVVKAVDKGGNESLPITTNMIGVDSGIDNGNGYSVNKPESPVVNYFSGIVLNRPIMDVDFYDKESGIAEVRLKIRRGTGDSASEDIVTFNQTINTKLRSDPVNFLREVCTPTYNTTTNQVINGVPSVVVVQTPATCNMQQFTGTANYLMSGYSENWTVPQATWDQVEENQSIDFIFEQRDKIGNLNPYPEIGDTTVVNTTFTKDTLPPSGIALNYLNNQAVFNGSQVLLSVKTSNDAAFYMLTQSLFSTASFVTDYSFEDAGYAGTRNSGWVVYPLIGDNVTLNAQVTADVVLMTGSTAKSSIYSLDWVSRAAFGGNFGLRIRLDLPIGTPGFNYSQVTWKGIEKNIPLAAPVTTTTNYSVYLSTLLVESMGGRSVCLTVDSYQGVTLSSTQLLNCYSNLNSSWRMLGGVVTLNAGDDRMVARVSFTPTKNLYLNPDPTFTIYNPINRNNAIYLDDLIVVKDKIYLPTLTFNDSSLVQLNPAKTVTFNLDTVSATYNQRTFTLGVRDSVGNWSFATRNIVVDSVTPSLLMVTTTPAQFTTNNQSLQINLSADDFGGSGIKNFYVKIMNERDNTQFYPTNNGWVTFNALTNTSNLSITLSTANAIVSRRISALDPTGIYRVYAYADDKVSNNSFVVTAAAFIFDNQGPTAEIIFDAPTVNQISAGVYRYSGWYDSPDGIGITLNFTDDWVTTNLSGSIYVSGNGVTTISYVINGGATQNVSAVSGSISFRLTNNSINTFKYWATDALGQQSAVTEIKPPFAVNETVTINGQTASQYYGQFILSNATSVTGNLGFGLYGFYLDTLPPTITSNLLNDTWLGMDNAPSFTLNDLGAGVKYIYYQIDSDPAQAVTVDGSLIGVSTLNYPLTTSVNSITQEGFFGLSYWAVDKFNHATSVNTVSIFKNDRGRPVVTFNALTSGYWITANAGITLNFIAEDFFATPVTYNAANYPLADQFGSYISPPASGVASLKPGSGPTKTDFWVSTTANVTPSMTVSNDNLMTAGNRGQFGYNGSITLTQNGINFLAYRATDLAGNLSTLNIVNDLRLDNAAPVSGSFLINKYASHPSYNLYVQYTSSDTVVLNLDYLKDAGIGIRYLYITGDVADDTSGASSILNPSPNAPVTEQTDVSTLKPSSVAYAPINRWFEMPLNKLNPTLNHDPDAPAGIAYETAHWPLRTNLSTRIYVRLAPGQGPKNIQVYVGDDFILGDPIFNPTLNDNQLIPADSWRATHMMFLGSQTVTYDTQMSTPQVTVAGAQLDGSVVTRGINLKIDSVALGDLSGIDAVYVDGEVTGNNARQWVTYVRHPSGATGEDFMLLPILLTEYEGTKNITVKLRDKAGSMWEMINTGFVNHSKNESPVLTMPIFYDQPMICNQSLGRKITWTVDGKPSNFWFRTPTWDVTIDCTGVNRMNVSGNVKNFADGITVNSLSGINFNPTNRIYLDDSVDGLKSVYFYLHDRGTIVDISNQLVLLDRVSPSVTTNAQTSSFYTDFTGAKINISAYDPKGPSVNEVANIKYIVYRINNDAPQTINFESLPIPAGTVATASVTINISTEGLNNILRFYAVDKAGNTSNETVITGIKVNRTPPSGQTVRALTGNLSGGVVYQNSTAVSVDVLAYNADWIDISGDVVGAPYSVSYNSKLLVTLTATQGTKNIYFNFRDNIYSDPNTLSVQVVYDNQAPAAPVVASSVPTLSYLTTVIITGNIEALASLNATQLITMNITANTQFRAVIRLNSGNNLITLRAIDLAGNASVANQISITLNPQAWVETLSGGLPSGVTSIAITQVATTAPQVIVANQNLNQIKSDSVTYLGDTIRDFTLVTTPGVTAQDLVNVFAQEQISIVIPYTNQAAMLGKPKNFRIFYLNPMSNRWELVPGDQQVDLAKKTVRVQVPHFSIYTILELTPASVDNGLAQVYPNPFISGDGDTNNGEFGAGQGVTFDNMTAGAEIKIYSISGALVKKLTANAAGSVLWDVCNESGERVASGIYVYSITGGNTKKVGRITVIKK